MGERDKGYYAQRAAEEAELALEAKDDASRDAHSRLQRAYTERASVGDRHPEDLEPID